MQETKGFFLVFLTALVSGFAVFANSFAVGEFNPFIFTFLKNAVVAAFLLSLLLLLKNFHALKSLRIKQLGQLAAIGLVGGSVPFLLYFYALKMTTAVNAGFLHKTLFIWAALFAFLFLREKISRRYIAAAFLLLGGNFLLFSISSFGLPEALILTATGLWAAENTISKHALRNLSGTTVAFGRMFFGSAFILLFLATTNQAVGIFTLSLPQLHWVAIASAFLFLYVLTYYSGLKHIPLHKAAAILLLGQPITWLLSLAFLGTTFSTREALGFLLIVAGISLVAGIGLFLHESKSKGLFACSRESLKH